MKTKTTVRSAVDKFLKRHARQKFVIVKMGAKYVMFRDLARGGSKGLELNATAAREFVKRGIRLEHVRGGL